MNNIKLYIVGALALSGVILGTAALHNSPMALQVPLKTGSVTSNFIPNADFTQNQVTTWASFGHYVAPNTSTGTTTPCSNGLQSPNATSTLVRTTFQTTLATSTALTVYVATSTNAYATTTLKLTYTIPANVLGAYTWTPTTTENMIFAPNTFVVWAESGGSGAGNVSNNAECTAVWQSL